MVPKELHVRRSPLSDVNPLPGSRSAIIRKPIAGDLASITAAWKTLKLDKPVERMERDGFDLIAVGRALISDPAGVQPTASTNKHDLGTLVFRLKDS